MDPDEYDRIYKELWPIFQADWPATFLFHASYATVADQRIRGLSTPWHADRCSTWMTSGSTIEVTSDRSDGGPPQNQAPGICGDLCWFAGSGCRRMPPKSR